MSCDHKHMYSVKYDTFFCKQCDMWRSIKCTDTQCEYCIERPEKPSLDKDLKVDIGVIWKN